jgi:hypothetical protein
MNGQELTNWRENCTAEHWQMEAILTEVKTDVKWIKDYIRKLDGQQDSLTKQVAWLRGLGSLVGIILGSVLALVSSIVFTGCSYEGLDSNDTIVDPKEEKTEDPSFNATDWVLYK